GGAHQAGQDDPLRRLRHHRGACWAPLCGSARLGARRHGAGLRTRHHHHCAPRRGEHFRRFGESLGGGAVDFRHPQPPQRNGACQYHRQYPDERDRGLADTLGPGSEHGAADPQPMERERDMKKLLLTTAALAMLAWMPQVASAAEVAPGKDVKMVLLPKFLGILPFDQAHKGALEAEKELKNPSALQFLGPTPENSVAGQIEIVTNAATQGVG